MHFPEPSLFGAPKPMTMFTSLTPLPSGYVRLWVSVSPYLSIEKLSDDTYTDVTLDEALDIIAAQAHLIDLEQLRGSST